MKKHVRNCFFLALGIGIIAFILSKVNLGELFGILRNSNPWFLLVGISLSLMQTILAAAKWRILLRNKDIEIPFYRLAASQMVGFFVSSFLPSRYSGDLYRTYVVAKDSGKAYDTAASVLLQRLSGLFVLVLIGFLGSFFSAILVGDYRLTLVVTGTCLAILVGIGVLFSQKAFEVLDKILNMIRLDSVRKPIGKFHTSMRGYWGEKALLVKICLISLLFYIQAFLIVFTAALAIGCEVPFIYIAFVVPVIYLLEALPISINGLGIREGAFVFFFTRIGLQYEQAFAVSIIVLFYRMVKTLGGGVIFLVRHIEVRAIGGGKRKDVSPA